MKIKKRNYLLIVGFVLTGLFFLSCGKSKQPLPPPEATLSLSVIYSGEGIFQGLDYDAQSHSLFFGQQGKEINRLDSDSGDVEKLGEVKGAMSTWLNNKDDVLFICDIKQGPDGLLYIAARKQILTLDPASGEVKVILDNIFSGPWGGYGLCFNKDGDLFVGDHYGGIQFFDKDKSWEKTRIIGPMDTKGPAASFAGVAFDEERNILYALDFSNSILIIIPLKWKKGIPVAQSVEMLELGLKQPDYLDIWKGDVFIQDVFDRKMVRVRDGEIIQTINEVVEEGEPVGSFVNFRFIEKGEDRAEIYINSWEKKGGILRGEISF